MQKSYTGFLGLESSKNHWNHPHRGDFDGESMKKPVFMPMTGTHQNCMRHGCLDWFDYESRSSAFMSSISAADNPVAFTI